MYKEKVEKMYKSSQARVFVARELLFLEVGDRIAPMLQWTEKYKISIGTLQKAFIDLEKEGMIKSQRKGVLGSYVVEIDNNRLLEESHLGYLIGVMPLPYSKRYEGLSTGIKKSFQNKNVEFHFAHMSGSHVRIEQLRKNVFDFAVISKLAFHLLSKKYSDIEVALELGESSYVSRHVLLKAPKVKKIKTLGIDKNSDDQRYLTEEYFNSKDYKWVDIDYNETINLLKNKAVDGIIGNLDEINEKGINLEYEELKDSKALRIANEGIIVIRKGDGILKKIIEKTIDVDYIRKIQNEVMNNHILPAY